MKGTHYLVRGARVIVTGNAVKTVRHQVRGLDRKAVGRTLREMLERAQSAGVSPLGRSMWIVDGLCLVTIERPDGVGVVLAAMRAVTEGELAHLGERADNKCKAREDRIARYAEEQAGRAAAAARRQAQAAPPER